MIQNIGEEDLQIYLTISVNGSQYSFKEHIVNITLSGEDFSDVSVYTMHVCLITKVHTFPNPADKSQIEVLPPFLSEKYEHYYYFSFTLTQNCVIKFPHQLTFILFTEASLEWTITIACVATLVPVTLLAIFLAGGLFLRLKRKR